MAPASDSATAGSAAPVGGADQRAWSTVEQLLPESVLAPRLARAILIVVFSGIYTVALAHILSVSKSASYLAQSAGYVLALLALQLFYFSRTTNRPTGPVMYLALLAQAALVYLPMLEFRQFWVGLPGFLAGTVLLLLPPVAGWTLFTVVVASMGVTQWFLNHRLLDVTYTTVSTIITSFIVYGLTRLARLVVELQAARGDLARMAVAEERLRFARDLHDLLGYSLSAITLKSELTHRLLLTHPAKAQEEVSDVLDIARRALSDVRAVASGYRELSLEAEAASARSVLIDAEVEVEMDLRYDELPVQVRTVLATVLREGITNVLRHSKAEWCQVTILQEKGRVRLDIVNDGVPQDPDEEPAGTGHGIANLSVRAAALGGMLTAGPEPAGRFRLSMTAPDALGHTPPRKAEDPPVARELTDRPG